MIFVSLEQAKITFQEVIKHSGGGLSQIIDENRLGSILTQIQDSNFYPDLTDKLTYLIFSINKSHCFADGNKRMAIALAAQICLMNGFIKCSEIVLSERMESISYNVAAGKIDRGLLKEIVESIFQEPDFNETLKLKIINATEI